MSGGANLSIAQRLGVGFVLLLGINIAALLMVRHVNQRSERAEQQFTTRHAPRLEAALNLRGRVLAVAVAARAVQIAPTEENRLTFGSDLQAAREQLARLRQLTANDGTFVSIAQRIDTYLIAAQETVGARMGDDAQNALRDRRLAFTDDLDRFIGDHRTAVGQSMNAMASAQQAVRSAVTAASVVSLLAFVVIASLIAISVRRPARDLLRAARAMSASDWRAALSMSVDPTDARSRNELMQLRAAFGSAAAAIELRERRLEAGRAVASAAAAGLSTALIAKCALEAIGEHVQAELGVVYACTAGTTLTPVASRGLGVEPPELPEAQGVPNDSARERKTIRIRGIPDDSAFQVRIGFDRAPARSVVSVPLLYRHEVLGVIVLASLRELDEDAVQFVEGAAQQLAVGFDNVRAFEQNQRLLEDATAANELIQAQREELQVQNEELQSQGEEIQAQNEELQAQSEEIRAQNEDLQLQAETLRSQGEALSEVDKRKDDFIGLLAHELRNPLATISNSLFVLRESENGHGTFSSARALDIMQRQMRQLQRLTDDLLDITRIKQNKFKLRLARIDLSQVVRDCVEDQRISAARANVILTLVAPETPVCLDADCNRISQVLCNLIDNAVKASPDGGEVLLTVSLHDAPARASVRIVDHGEGIAPDVLPRLFRPFVQAFRPASRDGGLGLGLSLVRSIVEMHGGTVDARSAGMGHGSTFVVTLPLEVAGDTAAQARDDASASLSPSALARASRVQIIEDNVDAAETLRYALEVAGHDVVVAHTAASGLEMMRTLQPDVLICDIGLPDASGYEVAAQVSKDPAFATTRLVALTGYATSNDQRRAREAGFHHHFAKPVTIEQLTAVLAPVASE